MQQSITKKNTGRLLVQKYEEISHYQDLEQHLLMYDVGAVSLRLIENQVNTWSHDIEKTQESSTYK